MPFLQEQLNNVLDAMFERKTVADEHIIDQGDDGDNFYVIDRGIFDIYVKIDGSDKKVWTKIQFSLFSPFQKSRFFACVNF